jgi:DNA-binding NarL/FixJ family response regulator
MRKMMDAANPAEPINRSQKLPAIAIIEDQVLARTCIVNILKRELTGFEIVGMATTRDLNLLSGRDVRLIAFNIGDKQITDPSIEDRLALLEESCSSASIALLSNRDDEATVSAAMQRGVRGFFASSISVELALAGLRLVLAGGVYRPLPIIRQNEATILAISKYRRASQLSAVHEGGVAAKIMPERILADLTPRDQHVLAALKLGLPYKQVVVRLNLSEKIVKMHIQHIMRKKLSWN